MRHLRVISTAVVLAVSAGTAQAAVFQGRLWLLPTATVSNASFPPPSTTPDATFTAQHLAFFSDAPGADGGAPKTDPYVNNTVAGFLDSANPVGHLGYSGLVNASTGAPVTGTTSIIDSSPASCGSYGPLIELTGRLPLTTGELITITHDDGIALKIDGVAVTGLTSGSTTAVAERFQFEGRTGNHTIDLIYTNDCGQGLLSVSPVM